MKRSKHEIRAAHKNAAHRAARRAYEKGFAEGVEQGHIDKSVFIRCPSEGCDVAIEIPLMLVLTGEPGEQDMRAEMDSTELWLHMFGHTGKISHED